MHELELFPHEDLAPSIKRPKRGGGSGNPIVFHDYESYIAKFAEREKTTGDTLVQHDSGFWELIRKPSLSVKKI